MALGIPFDLDAAGVLAALTHPNHLLVVDLKISRFIGIRLLAAYLQRQWLWVYPSTLTLQGCFPNKKSQSVNPDWLFI
ncbi:hypothetical protein B7R74_07205 [Yersinia pseudotuberculosis]|nr:hypothetical protein B7R74_07205 [Yersinia pseudotuberculosis]